MSDLSLPRAAERLLGGFGASATFRDALIGDLAEEFAHRAEGGGDGAARRWYYREALRAVPHLLGDWRRGLHRGDVRHFASVVGLAYVLTAVLSGCILLTTRAVSLSMGVAPKTILDALNAPQAFSVLALLMLGSIAPVVGGYVAAWLDDRAPMVSALLLGVAWSLVVITTQGIVAGTINAPPASMAHVPLWYRITMPVVVLIGTSVGCALRVASTPDTRTAT